MSWGPEVVNTPRTLTSRRVWLGTLLAYGASQGVILLGSVVRIPLLTGALGQQGYGTFIVLTSVWPIVQLLTGGLAGAARVSVAANAERVGVVNRSLQRTGTIEALALLGVAAVVLPILTFWLDPEVIWALACVMAGSAIVLPLAAHQGVLEGFGHTAASHLALSMVSVVGLPVLIFALAVDQSLVSVVAATMVGFVAPYVTCTFLARWLTHMRRPGGQLSLATQAGDPNLRALTGAMTGWGMANILVFLLDPVIIAITTGAAASAQYGLASRITGLVTALPVALGALLVVWFTRTRQADGGRKVLSRLRNSMLVSTAFGLALATFSIAFGPQIGDFLSQGAVETPTALYLWMAIYGGMTCAAEPLIAAWAAPEAARIRARTGLIFGFANVGLSLGLAYPWGPVGPIVATVVCNLGIIGTLLLLTFLRPELITHERGTHVQD